MQQIDLTNEKLKNAILYFTENTKYFGTTKLCKLLYFLDFFHYKQTGRSITQQSYFAWPKGPVPVNVYKEVTGYEDNNLNLDEICEIKELGEFKKIETLTDQFDEDVFTDRELELLKKIAHIFRDARAEEISEVSHLENHPWSITYHNKGERKKIDYDLVFSDKDSDSEDVQIIRDRQKERLEMYDNFMWL